jgi:transcriptional regulator with XRE-family HTH domain
MSKLLVDRAKKKLPERLASVRGDRSQRQFARDLGVFQQNVNRYESGTTPHTDFLIQLAVRENVSIDWLLLGKGRMRRGR